METGIKEKLERWKILAEAYLKEDKRVLIKDLEDNWYFADIIFVGEDSIEIKCYAPSQRKGLKFNIHWAKINYFNGVKND